MEFFDAVNKVGIFPGTMKKKVIMKIGNHEKEETMKNRQP